MTKYIPTTGALAKVQHSGYYAEEAKTTEGEANRTQTRPWSVREAAERPERISH